MGSSIRNLDGRPVLASPGICVATALVWLAWVDGVKLDRIDTLGGGLKLLAALVMVGRLGRPGIVRTI